MTGECFLLAFTELGKSFLGATYPVIAEDLHFVIQLTANAVKQVSFTSSTIRPPVGDLG